MPTEPLYNHGEIERYLKNQMTTAEMHAFEKVMLSDPFLSDAFEGYKESNMQLTKQHLSEINGLVNQKKEKPKVVGLASSRWLRIAAIFILLIGAAFITNQLMNKEDATNTIAETQDQTESEVDSISAVEEPMTLQQSPSTKAANDNTLTAPPVIETEKATAGSMASAQTLQQSADSAVAMTDTSIQLKAASAERATMTQVRAAKQLSTADAAGSSLQPKDGWPKFQAYVDKEVQLAKEKNAALNLMKVELEFSVDNNGNVADIKVINATNPEAARIASEILKKSPRWTPLANNPKAKIVINF